MSQRVVRVNELLQRELSHVLHTRYQGEAVAVTILGVDVAPNLHTATVRYSVVGDAPTQARLGRFLHKHREHLRREVGRVVTLKFLPHFEFEADHSGEHGVRINSLLDDMGLEGEKPKVTEDPTDQTDPTDLTDPADPSNPPNAKAQTRRPQLESEDFDEALDASAEDLPAVNIRPPRPRKSRK